MVKQNYQALLNKRGFMKKRFLSYVMLFASLGVISTITSCNNNVEYNSQDSIKLVLEDVDNHILEVGESLLLNLKVENINKKAIFVSSIEDVLTVNQDWFIRS